MEFLVFILSCLYFMVPAYFANMAPVFARGSFKELKVPLDLNTRLNKHRIFGKNKTFRGLFFGIILGVITAFGQYLLYNFDFFRLISLIDYSNWLLIGFLFGSGAIFGDLVKSFFKRRFDIKPGKPFIPWDQLDFVIGSLVFIYPVSRLWLPFDKILAILILSFVLHIIVNHVAYYLKIRKEKW